MIWRWNHSRTELRTSIRTRRRLRARHRRAAASMRALRNTVDPAAAGPPRPRPVERTGPVAPPIHGAGGRRYQVVELGEGRFGVKVGHRVVSEHATPAEANRCIELMEENR